VKSSDEIIRLREENAQLKARDRWLHDLLVSETKHMPPEWHLSEMETRIMAVLLRGHPTPIRRLVEIIYADRDEPQEAYHIIAILIHRLRGRLYPFGIKIVTNGWAGYTLDPPAKTIILKYIR
jgi:hypothetical protein